MSRSRLSPRTLFLLMLTLTLLLLLLTACRKEEAPGDASPAFLPTAEPLAAETPAPSPTASPEPPSAEVSQELPPPATDSNAQPLESLASVPAGNGAPAQSHSGSTVIRPGVAETDDTQQPPEDEDIRQPLPDSASDTENTAAYSTPSNAASPSDIATPSNARPPQTEPPTPAEPAPPEAESSSDTGSSRPESDGNT